MAENDSYHAPLPSHVTDLVVQASHALDRWDLLLAQKVIEEGRALVLALNKWDLSKKQSLEEVRYLLEKSLAQVRGVPVVPLSAKTGKNIDKLMTTIQQMYDLWNVRIPTGILNRWLQEAITRHPLPLVKGRRLRIKYITQVKYRPPTIAMFASKPEELPESYTRYLISSLRENFQIPGVPIRLFMRKGKNTFSDKK
jgi:Predicted GTPases